MTVYVTAHVAIPERDLDFRFVRSSGPGGQNVNKVASAVQLRFDLAGTQVLNEDVKARVRATAGQRLNDDGSILIIARRHRTQEQNRRDAVERLTQLLRSALAEPRTRHATRPTRGSVQKRLQSKRARQRTKQLRGRITRDD